MQESADELIRSALRRTNHGRTATQLHKFPEIKARFESVETLEESLERLAEEGEIRRIEISGYVRYNAE